MKKQYLANCLLILVVALSPTGRVSHLPVLDGHDSTQVFMPFIGYSPLVLVQKQDRCSRISKFLVRGDVTNQAGPGIYEVVVEANAYDQDGLWLETRSDTLIMTATLKSQLNPFEIGFSMHCAEVDYSDVSIKTWSYGSPEVYWPATLVYTSTVESFGYGTRVTAEFRNDAGLPMHDVSGLAWSLHEDYSIGPLRHIADSLAPGETVTYTEFLEGVYGFAISTIEVAAQGIIEP
jgi:hypothetical protein